MNKKIYLLPILLFVLALTSCEETKEVSKYDNWQSRNDAFIDSLRSVYDQGTVDKDGRKLERFALLTAPDNYIYYKVLDPVTGTPTENNPYEYIEGYEKSDIRPLYTDTVNVYYRGTLINGEYFDGFKGPNPTVFDRPIRVGVSGLLGGSTGVVVGWTEVLQRMTVGTRWKVFIPWEYAYGSSSQTGSGDGVDIPAYSALIFDMQLYNIDNASSNSLEVEEE